MSSLQDIYIYGSNISLHVWKLTVVGGVMSDVYCEWRGG